MIRVFIMLLLIAISNLAYSETSDVVNSTIKNTNSENSKIMSAVTNTSEEWGLTSNEWKNYLKLMEGSSKFFYKNLSPPEVLGINADNDEDMKHYAEVAATFEHNKLEREIRFNNAFHQAALRLYASEPLIKPFDMTAFTPIPNNKININK